MALYPCPECGKSISERAEKCPHCGAGWSGVCPECHNFRTPDSETCENCGYPFSRLNKIKGTATTIKDNATSVDLTKFGYGRLWLNFWIYVRFPIGLITVALALVGFPDLLLVLVPYFIFVLIVAIGLHRRRRWAWTANWFFIFELLIVNIIALMYADDKESQIAAAISASALALLWVWPNWVYFSKREAWFSDDIVSPTENTVGKYESHKQLEELPKSSQPKYADGENKIETAKQTRSVKAIAASGMTDAKLRQAQLQELEESYQKPAHSNRRGRVFWIIVLVLILGLISWVHFQRVTYQIEHGRQGSTAIPSVNEDDSCLLCRDCGSGPPAATQEEWEARMKECYELE